MGVILLQQTASAAPTLLQSTYASTTSGQNTTATTLGALTTGSLRLLFGFNRNGADRLSNPSGWTITPPATFLDSGGQGTGKVWYRVTQGGDSPTVSTTTIGNDFPQSVQMEFSACSITDQSSQNVSGGSATPALTNLGLTGSGKWLRVACFVGGDDGAGNSGPVAAGSGWTEIRQNGQSGGSAFGPYGIVIMKVCTAADNPNITSPNKRYAVGGVSLHV